MINKLTQHPILVKAKEKTANLPLKRHGIWPFLMLGLFLVSFGSSFFYFRSTIVRGFGGTQNTEKGKVQLGSQVCPLNGVKYSKEQESLWQSRRPLGVMIENHDDARPQSGLSSADVIYEAVAEGGITRFLAVYLCQDAEFVGPVRSARTYFLDWISEYDGLYTHVGGAGTPGKANALGQIEQYGIKALNQFNLGFPTFWRDYDRLKRTVATEHTMYSATDKLWEVADKKFNWGPVNQTTNANWSEKFDHWNFIDDEPLEKRGATASATVPFWDRGPGEYRVEWTYDKNENVYKRENGGIQHLDNNTGEQLTAKNIVIAFMDEKNANDGYPGNVHLLYGTIGTGEAWVLQNGKVVKGTWRKQDRLARTKFFDSAGNEISFVRGQIWIQIVPIYNKANVKAS